MDKIESSLIQSIGNGIYMTKEEIKVLEKYNISYKYCTNLEELIFKIECYLNSSSELLNDLEELSNNLSEFQYYHYTKK